MVFLDHFANIFCQHNIWFSGFTVNLVTVKNSTLG